MEYRIAGKFGGWVVYITTAKLKSAKISYSHVYTLYRTAKFKSANILVIAILGSTAKFNSCQYFRLYGILPPLPVTVQLVPITSPL